MTHKFGEIFRIHTDDGDIVRVVSHQVEDDTYTVDVLELHTDRYKYKGQMDMHIPESALIAFDSSSWQEKQDAEKKQSDAKQKAVNHAAAAGIGIDFGNAEGMTVIDGDTFMDAMRGGDNKFFTDLGIDPNVFGEDYAGYDPTPPSEEELDDRLDQFLIKEFGIAPELVAESRRKAAEEEQEASD